MDIWKRKWVICCQGMQSVSPSRGYLTNDVIRSCWILSRCPLGLPWTECATRAPAVSSWGSWNFCLITVATSYLVHRNTQTHRFTPVSFPIGMLLLLILPSPTLRVWPLLPSVHICQICLRMNILLFSTLLNNLAVCVSSVQFDFALLCGPTWKSLW